MKILYTFPPNFDEIANKFPVRPNTVFTYGDTLYSPLKQTLPADLIVHEGVHIEQQITGPFKPDDWWRNYIDDPGFRLNQELEAYREQYRFVCEKVKDRNMRAKFLNLIASDLSSAMYGRIIKYAEALREIRDEL